MVKKNDPQAQQEQASISWLMEINRNLIAENKRLKKTLGLAKLGAWEYDIVNDILLWDATMHELYDLPPGTFAGTSAAWLACIHPEDLGHIAEVRRQLYAAGHQYECEYRAILSDGKIRHLRSHAILERGEDGQPAIVTGISMDITRAKESEEQLRMLSVAVEQSPVCTVITDILGNIEYVNPVFTTLTGYEREEVIGKNPRFLKGDTMPEVHNDLWRTLAAGQTWRGVFHNRKKSGEYFYEKAIVAPMHDDNGAVTHYIAIKEDITHTMELEGQLRHSQRMQALGQMAGGIAHDFNNILSVINGYASILKLDLVDRVDCMESVSEILTAVARASKLTNNLLTFSRKQKLTITRLELNELVTSSVRFIGRLINEDIELKLQPFQEPLYINGDAGQLEQVLVNLAANSRDALPRGGTITVSLNKTELNRDIAVGNVAAMQGNYAVITFSDTGTGMDEATRSKLFEPFFTTKDVGQGTGLGMSIVYGIIQQHNGCIDVASVPGYGTTITIYLPLAATAIREESLFKKHPQGTETLLIVDDDHGVLRLMGSALHSCGYHVLMAENSAAALEIYHANSEAIKLVIIDVIMPGMNGAALCREIKQSSPGTEFMFISGHSEEFLRNSGYLPEGATLMTKPINPLQLAQRVRRLLDEQQTLSGVAMPAASSSSGRSYADGTHTDNR